MTEQTETELRILRDKAIANNTWYSRDHTTCAFLAADGRLYLIINGAPTYLFTYDGA